MDNSIYEKVENLCKKKHINIQQLETILDISRSSISKWKTSKPSYDAIVKVATYFNVSADYLIGLTDIESPIIKDKEIIMLHRAKTKMSPQDNTKFMEILKKSFEELFGESMDDDSI